MRLRDRLRTATGRRARSLPLDPTQGHPLGSRLLDALAERDATGVMAVLRAAESPNDLEFLAGLIDGADGRPPVLDDLVRREPDNALAHLARGAHGIGWAWEARGGGFADTVSREAFDVFFERLRDAEDDLMRAAELDPRSGVPWSFLLTSGRGLQIPKEELRMRFDECERRSPGLVQAHFQLLQGLCAKWYGTDEESIAFARAVADAAPEGSPLHALVPMAHLEAWRRREGQDQAAYFQATSIHYQIDTAAKRSVFSPAWRLEPHTVYAANVFLVAFTRFDVDPAREIALALDERVTNMPWLYVTDDPGAMFLAVRDA